MKTRFWTVRSFLEDVADPANGMDQAWFACRLQLGAQVADINFQNVGRAFKIQPPDAVHESFAGQHLAGSAEKEREQLIFGGRKFYLARAPVGHARACIKLNIRIAQDLVALCLAASQ